MPIIFFALNFFKEKNIEKEEKSEAVFAGVCLWYTEYSFQKDGILEVISGYSGGEKENSTYVEVFSSITREREAELIKKFLNFL
ncbi:MAG: peptide-methionine (S)-S-oxide reductase [candidate division WOR-3 bacterium]